MTLLRFERRAGAIPVEFHVDSFVSDRLKLVYHCVPKALSRSMLRYLASVDPQGYRIGERNVAPEIRSNVTGWRSFTFVRNPYSRVVSFYFNKFVDTGNKWRKNDLPRYRGLREDTTLAEFVAWLATDEGSDRHADPHFLSQHYFVLAEDGVPALDYVGRIENADMDLRELQDELGLDREPLPHLNSNIHSNIGFDSSRRWLDVLDDRSKRIIASRYDADFEFFGYERLPCTIVPLYPRRRALSRSEPVPAAAGSGARVRRLRGRALEIIRTVLARAGLELRRAKRSN
jgi:hypothetical protein